MTSTDSSFWENAVFMTLVALIICVWLIAKALEHNKNTELQITKQQTMQEELKLERARLESRKQTQPTT